ncbi:COR domain-containing protein [Chitinophaga sp. YIM B06452]|uniref:COR domain-containing protein n=1 Tax=Chitinophaga sp. YIM B06452 TaxID=3082158 RepID=UPI0031FE5D7A
MNKKSLSFEELLEFTAENKVDELDLSSFKDFTMIPDEVFSLSHLKSLELGQLPIEKISPKIKNLENLIELNIRNAKFRRLPIEIIEQNSLRNLTVSGKYFQNLPKEFSENKTLKYINLASCNSLKDITNLPKQLTYLNISDTSIRVLPSVIFELNNLVKLVIQNLELSSLPNDLFGLENLLSLFIGNNNFQSLPSKIANLNLLELTAYDNHFTKFPEVITELRGLQKLSLDRNKINALPDSMRKLECLQELDVSNNNFSQIPDCIKELSSLKALVFRNFFLSNPKFSQNMITEIPSWIIKLKNLKKLSIDPYPITNVPREIVAKGLDAIRNFFYSKLEADNEEFLYEAKMVIVGRGNVGKSVLTKKLSVPGYTLQYHDSTKGIEVLKNPFIIPIRNIDQSVDFKLNIWDFGGQEKYDATHQLFITGRTIYLFLTEAREESNYSDFYFWLNTIKLFGKNSPVIVVLSKIDERRKLLPQSTYKKLFENIVQFVDVSCSNGYEYTIDLLKKVISSAIQLLPQITQKLSNRWVDIRNELEVLSKTKDYINYAEYLDVCQRHKLDDIRADFLSQYLNDLGVIVHHQHDLLLRKTVFLNPDWCVDGMYKVLDDDKVFSNKGKFTVYDLQFIWKEGRFSNKQEELLKLMKFYNLCFELRDGSGYISPDLLPPDKPINMQWDNDGNLYFEYHYAFMPAGILSRFIVKSHSFIKGNLYWKYGVVLEHENTLAMVEEDYLKGKIKIAIVGENRKGLLAAIRMYINEVHLDFDKSNKLEFEEMIPCNCSLCKGEQDPHFYKFNLIKRYEQKTKKFITCDKSVESVDVDSLISDIQLNSSYTDLQTNSDLKRFIAQLLTNILEREILYKEGYLSFWRDQKCTDPKNEVEFQPYICSMLDNECRVRGIQLSREPREANGNIDILFTHTNKDNKILKVCVEIKKAHHANVGTSMNTQLLEYMRSVDTDAGIYLVFWFKNDHFSFPAKYRSTDELEKEIMKNNSANDNVFAKIINCNKPTSPSKIKKIKQS